MSSSMLCIAEENLSVAWARAFLAAMEHGVEEVAPLVIAVTGFAGGVVRENLTIRQALDATLDQHNTGLTCETVARTIFPRGLWNPARPRAELYERYLKILPRIRKCRGNQYGVYFERMIAHGQSRKNQLEHVIQTYAGGNHRRTALQAAILDPATDLTDQRMRGFPCLQQVAFVPSSEGGLRVIGFYPRQYIFERAYGNYLGLCWVGRFIAHELGLELKEMQCFIGVATLGDLGKTALQPLATTLSKLLAARG